VPLQTVPLSENDPLALNPVTGRADSYFYDVDLAIGIIDEETIVYAESAFDAESRHRLENLPLTRILVDEKEAIEGFACNLVSTGRDVIMSEDAPKLAEQLESRGYRIHTPRAREIAKGGGFIRCISLTL
jgi:N-dimethylarginine dimethylaminohydrolase